MANEDIQITVDVESKDINKFFRDFDKGLSKTEKEVKSLDKSFSAIPGVAVAATAAFAAFGTAATFAIKEARKIEDLETSFISFTGSAEAAARQVERLAEFSASTPFQLEQLAQANRTLLAFGSSTEESLEQLRQLGEVASATGTDIGELSTIFGQIQATGKLTGERFNQLVERGVNIGPALAKSLGVAESSLEDLRRQGKITSQDVAEAFRSITSEGGQFFGATERQSKTLSGALSTLDDNVSAVAATIGKQLTPVIVTLATATSDLLKELNKDIKGGLFAEDSAAVTAGRINVLNREIKLLETQISAAVSEVENANDPLVQFLSLFTGDAPTEVATFRKQLAGLKDELKGLQDLQETRKGEQEFVASQGGGGIVQQSPGANSPIDDPANQERLKKIEDLEKQITIAIEREQAARAAAFLPRQEQQTAEEVAALQERNRVLTEQRIALQAQKLELDGEFQEAETLQAVTAEELRQERVLEAVQAGEEERLAILKKARDEEFNFELKTARAQKKFQEQTYTQRAQTAQTGLSAIAELQKSGNQDAFNVGKAAALAQAAILIPSSALKAYESLAAFPPLAFAAAAAATAAGIANLNRIQSAKFTAFADGGVVPGTGNIDNVPALLTPGEIVVPRTSFDDLMQNRSQEDSIRESVYKTLQEETNALLRIIAFQEGDRIRVENITNSSTAGGVFYEPVEPGLTDLDRQLQERALRIKRENIQSAIDDRAESGRTETARNSTVTSR